MTVTYICPTLHDRTPEQVSALMHIVTQLFLKYCGVNSGALIAFNQYTLENQDYIFTHTLLKSTFERSPRYDIMMIGNVALGSGADATVYPVQWNLIHKITGVTIDDISWVVKCPTLKDKRINKPGKPSVSERAFRREQRIVNQLPLLGGGYEVVQAMDAFFIIMKRIQGVTLKQFSTMVPIEALRLAIAIAQQIPVQLASPLTRKDEGRVLANRDLHLGNIMVRQEGERYYATAIDFSRAKTITPGTQKYEETLQRDERYIIRNVLSLLRKHVGKFSPSVNTELKEFLKRKLESLRLHEVTETLMSLLQTEEAFIAAKPQAPIRLPPPLPSAPQPFEQLKKLISLPLAPPPFEIYKKGDVYVHSNGKFYSHYNPDIFYEKILAAWVNSFYTSYSLLTEEEKLQLKAYTNEHMEHLDSAIQDFIRFNLWEYPADMALAYWMRHLFLVQKTDEFSILSEKDLLFQQIQICLREHFLIHSPRYYSQEDKIFLDELDIYRDNISDIYLRTKENTSQNALSLNLLRHHTTLSKDVWLAHGRKIMRGLIFTRWADKLLQGINDANKVPAHLKEKLAEWINELFIKIKNLDYSPEESTELTKKINRLNKLIEGHSSRQMKLLQRIFPDYARYTYNLSEALDKLDPQVEETVSFALYAFDFNELYLSIFTLLPLHTYPFLQERFNQYLSEVFSKPIATTALERNQQLSLMQEFTQCIARMRNFCALYIHLEKLYPETAIALNIIMGGPKREGSEQAKIVLKHLDSISPERLDILRVSKGDYTHLKFLLLELNISQFETQDKYFPKLNQHLAKTLEEYVRIGGDQNVLVDNLMKAIRCYYRSPALFNPNPGSAFFNPSARLRTSSNQLPMGTIFANLTLGSKPP